ncbi:MAG: hypothetical protein ACI8ZT_001512, partial [Bacteroidia bacterium]
MVALGIYVEFFILFNQGQCAKQTGIFPRPIFFFTGGGFGAY